MYKFAFTLHVLLDGSLFLPCNWWATRSWTQQNNSLRQDTVDLRALESWRHGQLNLAHGTETKNKEAIKTKNSPIRDWQSTPTYCQLQSHVTQKLGKNKKNPAPISFRYCPLIQESVVICQPHCKWGRYRWKWPNFRLSRARDLDRDLGSGHTAYHHASLIDFYLHAKFHWNRRNFLWTATYCQLHVSYSSLAFVRGMRLLKVNEFVSCSVYIYVGHVGPPLSDRSVCWPRRMLPPSESRWVCRRNRQTDRQTDGRQTVTLHFPLDAYSIIIFRNLSKAKEGVIASLVGAWMIDCWRCVCSVFGLRRTQRWTGAVYSPIRSTLHPYVHKHVSCLFEQQNTQSSRQRRHTGTVRCSCCQALSFSRVLPVTAS